MTTQRTKNSDTNLQGGTFDQVYQSERSKKDNYRKVGIHEWWTDYCGSHGKTAHSTAWGGKCIVCAKHIKT
jgi:hypothetical protein